MGHDDRDQNFEQALTRHFRAAGGDGATNAHVAGCPDAEMLAAFHERMLPGQEMDATKEHVVGCSRCQAVLALLETTDEIELRDEQEKVLTMSAAVPVSSARSDVEVTSDPNAAARSLYRAKEPRDISRGQRPRIWQWVAPVGAMAACLLIWIAVRESKLRQPEGFQNVQIAREQARDADLANGRSTLAPAPAPPPNQSTDQLQANERARRQTGQTLSAAPLTRRTPQSAQGNIGGELAGNNRPEASAGAHASVVGGSVAKRSKEQTQREGATLSMEAKRLDESVQKKDLPVAGGNQVAKTSDSPAGNADSMTTADRVSGRNVASREMLKTPAANVPRAQAGASQQTAPPASTPAASSTRESPQSAHIQADQANGDTFSASTETVEIGKRLKHDSAVTNVSNKNARIILVPGGTVEWRLRAPSIIERSVDGGLTWTPQPSATSAELLAGAAPSEVVCWIVGRSGTILRTTDGGGHWSKVVSPFAGDIGGITADDAMHAVISGLSPIPARFATNDGGVTWFRTNK
jgi:hypothetical protein